MILQALQRRHRERGFLSDADLRELAEALRVPLDRLETLVSFYPSLRRTPPARVTLAVCRDMSCHLRGGRGLADRLRAKLSGVDGVEVCEVSCLGRCDTAPSATVNGVPVGPVDLEKLVTLAKAPEKTPRPVPPPRRRFGFDPWEMAMDRYGAALAAAKGGAAAAAGLVATLKAAGLRGLGGTAIRTADKWDAVRKEAGTPKYVVCNASESEPGAFKDREILAQAPHLVLEGMILAGLVVGAERGIVFVRREYGPEQDALEDEIASARKKGRLGTNACGSGRPFDVEVLASPGGYVLGEETALLEVLEDRRGEPRDGAPSPEREGLFGKPTLVNNVETFAMAPAIATRGAAWWRAQGKRGAPGLKLFAVSGHVERPGVYEVPLGTTVGELLARAGGVIGGKQLKAFAPGGASSSWLPAAKLDVPLDFEALAGAGAKLGSGAVVFAASGTDLLDLGRNVTAFFASESCGKCAPCRDGSREAVALLDDVLARRAGRSALDMLPPLHDTLAKTSICGLGRVALVPVLSVVRNFPRDVLSHVGSGLVALADLKKG